MKILLLSPPYLPEYMRNARCDFVSLSATQWYPILLGYCGAYLEGLGHRVKLIDAPAHHLDHDAVKRMVFDFNPDLLVLYTGSMSEDNDVAYADSLLETAHCEAVIVGPFASIDPEKTLGKSKAVHLLVAGEFELSVGEIASGRRSSEIGNLYYRENGRIKFSFRRPYMGREELDSIPFVSKFLYEQVEIRRYKTPSELYPFMDLFTGRGCRWGRCTYCLWVHSYIKGSRYNQRSIGHVVEELKYIEDNMPEIRSVMIQDDTFTEERAAEFCTAKIREGVSLPWSCYARADLSAEVLRLMKDAGCRNVHVGYESGDAEVLKRIRKGITIRQMVSFTEAAKLSGLCIHGDFAMGFPGETPESAMKTIRLACRLRPHTAQFQLMIPFPGTPYYDEMKENGWLNGEGQPDMPQFSNEQIRLAAKKAYRTFYFSPHYLRQCFRHPHEHVFGRIKTIWRAFPAMFWKKWNV